MVTNLSHDLSPLEARSCSMCRVTTRRNLKSKFIEILFLIIMWIYFLKQMNSSTDLLFDPSSSSLAPGSIISSCLSLQYPLFENINFNDHVCKILCFKTSTFDHVYNIICLKTSTFNRSGFHLSFSSAARSFLSFSNQALAYSPHLTSESRYFFYNEEYPAFRCNVDLKQEYVPLDEEYDHTL